MKQKNPTFSWSDMPKPLFALAPMEDVTDTVFRQIVGKYARPDVFYTEFTSSDAICSEGEDDAIKRLVYTEGERPIIAQIWGVTPEHYFESAKRIAQMGFDGIDINMGCPVRDIVKKGACSALIKNKPLAKEIIQAVKDGVDGKMPVSVKTRIGFNDIQTEEWIGFLLEQSIGCLTIHGRTVKEMSKYPVHWGEIGKAVTLRNSMGLKTPILGNGDILSYTEGLEKIEQYGLDGIMIGRGIFQNLFIFDKTKDFRSLSLSEKFTILTEHISLYEKTWKGKKSYNVLKKYFKIYVNGFDGASDIRVKLMETRTPDEARDIITSLV